MATYFPNADDVYSGREKLSENEIEAFWSKVAVGPKSSCWEWTATPSQRYGLWSIARQKWVHLKAHRVSWLIKRGPIPDGLYVCHSCDNPRCCNPEHLWLGTNSDNQLDSVRKGISGLRHPPSPIGEAHHSSRLTADLVREIRRSVEAGELRTIDWARNLGISNPGIRKVVQRKSWRHIE